MPPKAAAAISALAFSSILTAGPAPDSADGIARMQVTGQGGTIEGTAFLVHQEPRGDHVVHYFVTAAHLLNPEAVGERRTLALRVRLMVDAMTIESSGSAAVFPAGVDQGLDVAIVKATSTITTLQPMPVTFDTPAAGDSFAVWGRRGGELIELAERVRFRSTRLVVGDRTAADVNGLMGAPAIAGGRVFGLVSECSATRVPVITLLDAARRFLMRGIPEWIVEAPGQHGRRRGDGDTLSDRLVEVRRIQRSGPAGMPTRAAVAIRW